MRLDLSQIRFIDKKKSTLDKEKSKPEKGEFVFKKKVYTKPQAKDMSWVYRWKAINNIEVAKIQKNFIEVTKFDEVIPETIKPNEQGFFQLGDVILMKTPLTDYVERKQASQKLAYDQAMLAKQPSTEKARKMGAGLTESEIEQATGIK